ncbi:NAD(P)-dependent oxidoreductase [Streptomyces sparsogenes]|uniref:NAD(P)-dependent oxidoreductase n=1 Tax=Streptomyces sparsogenes TaxID=67365 RepID=UPI0033FA95CC
MLPAPVPCRCPHPEYGPGAGDGGGPSEGPSWAGVPPAEEGRSEYEGSHSSSQQSQQSQQWSEARWRGGTTGEEPEMANVAVVGLGIMGRGMAENLLKHGHTVTVWNRGAERARELAESGAVVAGSPAEAAARAEVVFEVTADDASSRQVWQGPDGILAGAREDAVLIASATLSVAWVRELAALCERRGSAFFDIPLTGGAAAAKAGTLVLLAGGDAGRLPALRPVFDAVAREVKHFGPAGAGTRFKLVLNALQAVHLAGFGEALRLAQAVGLDPRQVGTALLDRPGGVVTQLAWDNYLNPPEPVNFSAEWAHKDLAYAARMAQDAGEVRHPLLDGALSLFADALAEGRGKEDWSTVNPAAPEAAR